MIQKFIADKENVESFDFTQRIETKLKIKICKHSFMSSKKLLGFPNLPKISQCHILKLFTRDHHIIKKFVANMKDMEHWFQQRETKLKTEIYKHAFMGSEWLFGSPIVSKISQCHILKLLKRDHHTI